VTDETRAPAPDPGRRKTKTGCFWALARDDRPWGGEDPPGVAFTYAPGRSGQYAEDILKGFSGVLQVPSHGLQANHCRAPDGYAGYKRLLKPADRGIELAYCWAHAPSRACKHALPGNGRKLHEVAKTAPPRSPRTG
jgi:transposase